MSEPRTLGRDVIATLIPFGTPITLTAGSAITITQALGGSYTGTTERGYLVRIEGRDADAIGEQLLARATLARLKPAYRIPLVLYLCEDLTTAEISEVLGIRRGAVKMRLARARRQFQRAFRALSGQESDEV